MSKKRIIDLISSHYFQAFSTSNAANNVKDYEDDLKTLAKIIRNLKKKAEKEDLMDKFNISYMANLLEENYNTMRKLIDDRDRSRML